MKTLLVAINAKYIHPNLAIRLLKKNADLPVDICEFTIKDAKEKIINYILENNYEVVGFSCYIWNIKLIKAILSDLKDQKLTIILGGPEVSYNAFYYLENDLADFVIKNEGEEAFNLLLHHLKGEFPLVNIPNLYYPGGYTFDKLVDLNKSQMAYDMLDDLQNKIVYLETSRGCPYHCGYCMASLDNKVRFFEIEKIKKEILTLNQKGARVYKFLDRTFNANKKNFLSLIDFIIANHKEGQSYQFEITGDLLDSSIIDYINNKAPKNLFRFEIGIQSTNIKTNLSVGRIQNNAKLFYNINLIQNANIIDLHLDLIAGLPYEDYSSFANTFNEVVALKPKELQLGFLKLLYGTPLHHEAQKYNYIWQNEAPYEVIENDFMSPKDIKNIHIAEDAFETYYNQNIMPNAIRFVIDQEESPFAFFYDLGQKDFKRKPLEVIFRIIDDFVKTKEYYSSFHQLLLEDYLKYFKVKPKAWWDESLSPKERNEILREIEAHNELPFSLTDLYKYSLLIRLPNKYLLAIYKPNSHTVLEFNSLFIHN